ncbi:3-hydroxyacyl-CoA dehydrogenase family protein [Alloscardovia venturai]|uniref:L-gulonate 3-dehydrogenase n=1 Tax=Alloscardovia venturai TaxID=1769421 RepID=A0ABW2Y3E2_9BIFI
MRVEDIKTVAAIGAGTMGHSIAMEFAVHGYNVHLIDMSEDALSHGLDMIRHDAVELSEHHLIAGQNIDDILARITTFTSISNGVHDVQYVTESVAEKLEIKQSIWKQVEENAPQDAIFTTNTSGLSPSAIAEVLKTPHRFVVAHYWNPAHLMPLVEVVPSRSTSQDTVDTTVAFLRTVGKKAYPLKRECLGFVGNRIQMAVIREALNIVSRDIATAEDVDNIIKYSLGRRWSILGPIISADLGGLDIFESVSEYLLQDADNSTTPNQLLAEKVRRGELGNKTGRGFYDWNGDEGIQTVAHRDEQLMKFLERDVTTE